MADADETGGVTSDEPFEVGFSPSYHLEWLVGDEVVFEPEPPAREEDNAA